MIRWLPLVLASVAQAQGLPAFIESAQRQNFDQRLSIAARERAEAEFRAAWAGFIPSLSVSAAWTHNQFEAVANFPNPATGMTSRLVIILPNQLDANVRFEVPLINTSVWFRTMAAGELKSGAQERERATADLVRLQVTQAYYGYAAALGVRDSAKRSVEAARAQLNLSTVRNEAGSATELELLRAKAELARTEQTVIDAEALVATTGRSLETLSGLAAPGSIGLPDDDVHPEPAIDELMQQVETLPQVLGAERDLAAAQSQATAAKLGLVPVVNGQFTQRFTNATGFQGQAAVYNFGITLAWRLDVPAIMSWAAVESAVRQSTIAAERAQRAARDAIFNASKRFDAAVAKAASARAQGEAARRAAQVAADRYAVGAATQVDVIQADRDAFNADVALIQARTDLASARTALRVAAGLP